MVKVYNKNHFLLTSRPYTDIDLLPLFHNLEVCELSDSDINNFIRKQIPDEEKELCEKMIEAVNSSENHSYKSFLTNPLLLSMFILTFQSYSNIPQKRSEFYSQVFDSLYSVHDSMSKLAFVREKQSGLSKEQIIEVLKLFSFLSYFDEKFVFSGLYLEEKLIYIKQKRANLKFDNQLLLNDFQVAIGILNKEGTDYTFPHRSLQEYFAAIYISSLNEPNKGIIYKKIVSNLAERGRFGGIERDNFHLLLSELDSKSVIQYAIIPFLDQYIDELDLDNKSPDGGYFITQFLKLKVVYDSFYSVIKIDDLTDADHNFSEKWNKYLENLEKGQKKITEAKDEELRTSARILLAKNDIHQFLISYKSKIIATRTSLRNFLDSENQIDSEIISIVDNHKSGVE